MISNESLRNYQDFGTGAEKVLATEALSLRDALETVSEALQRAENAPTLAIPIKNRSEAGKLRYLARKLDEANERMNGEAHNPGAADITGVAFALEMMADELEKE